MKNVVKRYLKEELYYVTPSSRRTGLNFQSRNDFLLNKPGFHWRYFLGDWPDKNLFRRACYKMWKFIELMGVIGIFVFLLYIKRFSFFFGVKYVFQF